MRIERAEYEAALAERRYQECDPAYRLVAATLERRWNDTFNWLRVFCWGQICLRAASGVDLALFTLGSVKVQICGI
jgi:hypothetical protein